MRDLRIKTAEWLLPREGSAPEAWACVACDQFTSQPEYWAKVRELVGDKPGAVKLIIPESELEKAEERIPQIHGEMAAYLKENILCPAMPEGFILVERTTESGVRFGLMAAMDLEGYDYKPGSQSLIRPTEGTIVERIPPRLRVRRGAPVELSHVMMLVDDPADTVLGRLQAKRHSLTKLYDFSLMMGGGHLTGYGVTDAGDVQAVKEALAGLAQSAENPLLYAVGDGNHSLATAKAYWEEVKAGLSPAQQENHPARFAAAEIVNLHSDALCFEPIHRVLFGVRSDELLADIRRYAADRGMTLEGGEQEILCVFEKEDMLLAVGHTNQKLAVGTLQTFLDEWLQAHPSVRLDYVHGEDTVRTLTQAENTVGFLLPAPDKANLFPAVIQGGVLPRKTFSMGEAWEKRYYMEARRIERA